MGCDIHSKVQVFKEGRWETVKNGIFPYGYPVKESMTNRPFNFRNYGMFGFLADVRNYSFVPSISQPRGIPDGGLDSDEYLGDHSFSWLRLDELTSFNYDLTFEDRRTTKQIAPNVFSGAADSGEGNGKIKTFREFIGPDYFRDLEIMKSLSSHENEVRIVFGFDN